MNQKVLTYKHIIWILFGFALLSAVITLIKALIYIYFHYGLNNGFIEIHFKYYIPVFAVIITIIFSVVTFGYIRQLIFKWQVYKYKIPIIWLLLCFLISITDPFIKKISDANINLLYEDLSKTDYLSERNFDLIFNSLEFSVFGTQWVLFVMLLVFSLYLMKVNKN